MKIFISYSSNDLEIAEYLEKYLSRNNLEVWRDRRVVRNWAREIALNLTTSDVVILIWTDDSKKSPTVGEEWLVARALEKAIRPIIFLNSPKLPDKIYHLQAAKVDANSHEMKYDEIHSSKRSMIDKVFLKLIQDLQVKTDPPYDFRTISAKSNLSIAQNQDFIGRNKELCDIYLMLIGEVDKNTFNIVGISGLSGTGKTQLATETARRFDEEFPLGIFWIEGHEPNKWLQQLVIIARDYLHLKISYSDRLGRDSDDEDRKYMLELREYCKSGGVLFIIDDIVDPTFLNDPKILFKNPHDGFPMIGLGCHIIFTTKRRYFVIPGVKELEIPLLPEQASYHLLTKGRTPEHDEEKEYARKVCKYVGYMPLALVMINVLLNKRKDIGYEVYYNTLQEKKLTAIDENSIRDEDLLTRHKASIKVTFDELWKIMEKDDDISSKKRFAQLIESIFQLIILFPESSIIPRARIHVFLSMEENNNAVEQEIDFCLNVLQKYFLIELLTNRSIRIHPLIREYAYEKFFSESSHRDMVIDGAVSNFVRCYADNFENLVSEYNNRGIKEVLEDYDIATKMNDHLKDDGTEINDVLKILRRDQHIFRDIESTKSKKMLFAQQYQVRSEIEHYNRLANRAEEFLLKHYQKTFFLVKWSIASKPLFSHAIPIFEAVSVMSLLPKHNRIALGTNEGSIIIYDIRSGEEIERIQAYEGGKVNSMVAVDSTTFVSVGTTSNRTNVIKIISQTNSGVKIKEVEMIFNKYSKIIDAPKLVLVPHSRIVVFADYDLKSDYDLELLNIDTMERHGLRIRNAPVHSIAVTPDGRHIIVADRGGLLQILDIDTKATLFEVDAHTQPVDFIQITPDNNKLVTSAWEYKRFRVGRFKHKDIPKRVTKVWDKSKKTIEQVTTIETNQLLTSIDITPDSQSIVFFDLYGMKIFDITTGKEIYHYRLISRAMCYQLKVSPYHLFLCDCVELKIAEADTFKNQSLLGRIDSLDAIALTPDKTNIIAYSSEKHLIKVLDVNTGKEVRTIHRPHNSSLDSIAVSSDKIICNEHNKIRILDVNTGDEIHEITTDNVKQMILSPDGNRLVVDSLEGMKLFDVHTGTEVRTIPLEFGIASMVSSIDSKKIIVSDMGRGNLKTFALDTGEEIWGKNMKTGFFRLSWNPVISKVCCLIGDIIKIIDIQTGEEISTLNANYDLGSVRSVEMIPGEDKLLIADQYGLLKLVDIHSHKICGVVDVSDTIDFIYIVDKNKSIIHTLNKQIFCMAIHY